MPVSTAVKGSGVSLGYADKVALDVSDFDIPFGKLTAVIGPNGSGKSTLLSGIAGLLSPLSGTIELGGDPSRVAYVMQSTKVNEALPVSVREVVTMGRYANTGPYRRLQAADIDAVESAMARLEITDISNSQLGKLSGGQRQRVFVAQGLAQDHDILLLDEPLTGIDITTAMAIDEVIHDEMEEGCAVIITTHDLSEAQVADHVLLVNGRVVAEGPPASVLTEENLREAYGSTLLHAHAGGVFLDDPAHRPTDARHLHQDRVIHPEADQRHD
jgi:manganese transport system ATP-binding protein